VSLKSASTAQSPVRATEQTSVDVSMLMMFAIDGAKIRKNLRMRAHVAWEIHRRGAGKMAAVGRAKNARS